MGQIGTARKKQIKVFGGIPKSTYEQVEIYVDFLPCQIQAIINVGESVPEIYLLYVTIFFPVSL